MMVPEHNGNGVYRTLLVGALTLLVGLSGGYLLRKTESVVTYSAETIDAKVTATQLADAEIVRRLVIAEMLADEYRRDVSQINNRIAVIEQILKNKGN